MYKVKISDMYDMGINTEISVVFLHKRLLLSLHIFLWVIKLLSTVQRHSVKAERYQIDMNSF